MEYFRVTHLPTGYFVNGPTRYGYFNHRAKALAIRALRAKIAWGTKEAETRTYEYRSDFDPSDITNKNPDMNLYRSVINAIATWVLVFAVTYVDWAYATVPEIPGDGIDNGTSSGTKGSCSVGYADAVIGGGCDLLLPGDDKDNDGYTTATDCDDTNRLIIPNEYYPCDAGGGANSGYRMCGASATWGSCTSNSTPLCEATGSGVCKYVDCSSGSNSNSGTYASPYADLGKVSGGATGTNLPSSRYTLAPGDVVYMLGSGTCTQRYEYTSVITGTAWLSLTQSGTSSNRITVKRYPGATTKFSGTAGLAFLGVGGDYVTLEDLDITTGVSTATTGDHAIRLADHSDNWEISRVYIHDSSGHGDYNFSCIYEAGNNALNVHHSFLQNCRQAAGNVNNVDAIKYLDNEDSGTGADMYAHHNVVWWDTYSDSTNGRCVRSKHGTDLEDAGTNGNRFEYNYCINARGVINWDGSGLRARHIFAYSDAGTEPPYIIDVNLGAGESDSAPHEDNIIEDSTFVNLTAVKITNATASSTTEKLTFRRNVVYDNNATYTPGNIEGVTSILGYYSDTRKAELEAIGFLAFDNNCYYNPTTTLNFAYFSVSACGDGCGEAGNAGGNYNFADWKTNSGQDANSYVVNPTFDSSYVATHTSCSSKGYFTGTTTTTTTTTSTTTTTTTSSTTTTTEPNVSVPMSPMSYRGIRR